MHGCNVLKGRVRELKHCYVPKDSVLTWALLALKTDVYVAKASVKKHVIITFIMFLLGHDHSSHIMSYLKKQLHGVFKLSPTAPLNIPPDYWPLGSLCTGCTHTL